MAPHASLSHYDVRNTRVASGPGLKVCCSTRYRARTIDLVPIILWILGVTQLDDRVLHEALAASTQSVPEAVEQKIEVSAQGRLAGTSPLQWC